MIATGVQALHSVFTAVVISHPELVTLTGMKTLINVQFFTVDGDQTKSIEEEHIFLMTLNNNQCCIRMLYNKSGRTVNEDIKS